MPEATVRYLICKHMSWDYWTYQKQPVHFVQEVWNHYVTENEVKARQEQTAAAKMSR